MPLLGRRSRDAESDEDQGGENAAHRREIKGLTGFATLADYRLMTRRAALILLALTFRASAIAQVPAPSPSPEKRSWLGRAFSPFHSGDRLPEYKDLRLRGLVLTLELSPQPVKLSEVRQLEVRLMVTNKGRREIPLDFPNEQRIEIHLRNAAENILTKWSDNHAFADDPGTVLINPGEHVDYTTTIATRDLAPNKVFIAEVFFPNYPELTIRQKFLTAP